MSLFNDLFFQIATPSFIQVKLKCIIEVTLSHETTWDCWGIQWHWVSSEIDLLIFPKIFNLYDWVTGTWELFDCLVLSIELQVITRLHISSMVLVEIIQLIVDIDWSRNTGLRDVFEIYPASTYLWVVGIFPFKLFNLVLLGFLICDAVFIVPLFDFNNLVAHHVKYNSYGQEHHTENAEGHHCAHSCWNWPPCWKSLLFEFWLLQFFYFFTDALLLVSRYVHFLLI